MLKVKQCLKKVIRPRFTENRAEKGNEKIKPGLQVQSSTTEAKPKGDENSGWIKGIRKKGKKELKTQIRQKAIPFWRMRRCLKGSEPTPT